MNSLIVHENLTEEQILNLYHQYFIVNTILASLGTLFFLILVIIGNQVFQKVQFKNKTLLGMILCMTLAILGNTALFVFNAIIFNSQEISLDKWAFTILPLIPVTFFSIAVILNLNSWIYYYIFIGENMSRVDLKVTMKDDQQGFKRYKNMLYWGTSIMILIISCFSITIAIYSIKGDMNKSEETVMVTAGINFITLGFVFAISGYKINKRLKKHFKKFYQENKILLIVANLGLSIPLILRGIVDLVRRYSLKLEILIQKNIAAYDVCFFVVCDLIPLTFQLTSLVFGYIRSKKEKRVKLLQKFGSTISELNHQNLDISSIFSLTSNTDSYFDPPLLNYVQQSQIDSASERDHDLLNKTNRSLRQSDLNVVSRGMSSKGISVSQDISLTMCDQQYRRKSKRSSEYIDREKAMMLNNPSRLSGGFILAKQTNSGSDRNSHEPEPEDDKLEIVLKGENLFSKSSRSSYQNEDVLD